MRMTLANYKKFQPYSYHRQPLLKKKKKIRTNKINSLPPNLNFTLSTMEKKGRKTK